MSMKMGIPYYQLIQNNVLGELFFRSSDRFRAYRLAMTGQEFSDVLDKQFGMTTFLDRGTAASTDFVSLLPSFILFRALICRRREMCPLVRSVSGYLLVPA